jgi:YD repeat-containing protein
MLLGTEEPLAVAVVEAIHAGDLESLERLLGEHPGLASAGLGGDVDNLGDGGMVRFLLHVATDWPGHYPNGAAVVRALVADARGNCTSVTDPTGRRTTHTYNIVGWLTSICVGEGRMCGAGPAPRTRRRTDL